MMNGAKAIAKKYNEVSLILRIVVGLVIGAVLALAVPGAGWVGELGSLFVGALKGIAFRMLWTILSGKRYMGWNDCIVRCGIRSTSGIISCKNRKDGINTS